MVKSRWVKLKPKEFKVGERKWVNLDEWPTRMKPSYDSKQQYEIILAEHVDELSDLQSLLYASNRNALLLIFQGMDSAGKDGTIKHVMSGVNPQGCRVSSFKHPTASEIKHDFLWRTTRELPERGQIGIFNRSYYEEVLIARVHPEILAGEGLKSDVESSMNNHEVWKTRYRSILDLENHLHRNGTQTIKFFLHLSPDEQRKRFLERIDDPKKNWKLSNSDLSERALWKDYQRAYEKALSATSTSVSPWYVVPADDKRQAHLITSRIIIEALKQLKMTYPSTGPQRLKELKSIRKELVENIKI
ncbi:MAG: polyphosphate kinase 2 family protein [Cryobacterium sp.]|nr:polyphosphate kinase 2 family protein [Oligoflexia bacterium]